MPRVVQLRIDLRLAGAQVEAWGLVFKGCRVSVWEEENVLETESGHSCKTMRMGFMPLSCMLKNG